MAWMVLPRPISSASKRAFGEGQVQHALALVGKERDFGFVRRPFAALHLQLVFAPELLALRGAAAGFQPRVRVPARGAIRAPRRRPSCLSASTASSGGPCRRAPSASNHSLKARGQGAVAVEQPDRVAAPGRAPRPAAACRSSRPPRNSRLKRACKVQQHRLDVLAGAQPVDAEIHAIAGELPLAHVADFHRVGQAAAGLDAEVGEDRMARDRCWRCGTPPSARARGGG